MKVTYITMQFLAASETFARSDVKALERLGVDVTVHSLKGRNQIGNGSYHVTISEFLKSIYGIFSNPLLFSKLISWLIKNEWRRPSKLFAALYLVPRAFSIFSALKKSNPDVVHLFWGHYPSIVGYLVYKSNMNTKLSMFLGAYDLEMKLNFSLDLARKLEHVFTHAYCNRNRILKLCNSLCDVTVIHRGVDVDFLRSFSNKEKDPNLWVTGGRLIRDKRFDKVLLIFKEYSNKNPAARLVIAGDGPEEERLKEMSIQLGVSKSVQFSGFLPQSELFKTLSASSAFLFLSEKPGERLPNIVKEAMFFENCCYVSETPGIEELIDNNQDGIIIGNEKKFDNSVAALTPQDYLTIGRRAKNKIVSNFDVNVQMKKYIEVWDSL
ncbi:glycosyltransferase [Idiomarina abyssalis]|uniref:glycosyltransferase n=1 Tax=Idiomarina abyssalis TaxID=86102 RepID=UPI001C93CBDC|nr:glycosyltransferase [Idiomarina abyssalis]QZN91421.1 glycosyltransferase [Idiomarina abyssalis]